MTAAVHLTLAGTPGPSPHTRVVSGPNVKIAMLRALAQRAATSTPVIWEWVKRGVALVARTPGWVGHAVLGVLSTPAGYSSAVQLVSTGAKAGWRLIDRAACLVGRGVATITGLAASSVRHTAPTWGQALVTAHADLVDTVNALHDLATRRVSDMGQHLEQLAHASLVKTTATRAAAAASGLLVLNIITKGILAGKALEAAPSLAGLVVAATSPWWLLVVVTGVTVGAIVGVAYLEAGKAEMPQDLVVNVASDGSITVTGIPRGMSKEEQERISAQAAQQALAELTKGARPTSSGRTWQRPRHIKHTSKTL